jgi:SAM-dependent methyltransferase
MIAQGRFLRIFWQRHIEPKDEAAAISIKSLKHEYGEEGDAIPEEKREQVIESLKLLLDAFEKIYVVKWKERSVMESDVRSSVKEVYGNIAKNINSDSGCGCGCSPYDPKGQISSGIYGKTDLENLPLKAVEASLGCANPLLLAELQQGETVLDLGSGGGIDVLMATRYVGETGKVYGLDMTDEMLALANENKQKMGVANVEFLKGYIEEIPLKDEAVDVIMSNCVINLTEDKEKALAEAYRVLKKGGRLAIADIVTIKDIPEDIKKKAAMWSSCLGGTLSIEDYESILKKVGFTNLVIEPVQIYNKEFITGMASCSCFEPLIAEVNLDAIDGAFASAYIKAEKR